jgi:2-keto-4-pentenoate hydratase/2-oxohepta-3-ene-1,7-dioic acid hydratase in catechol pathway
MLRARITMINVANEKVRERILRVKLLRYGPSGQERPGMLDAEGRLRDLSSVIPDIAGASLDPAELQRLAKVDPSTFPLVTQSPRVGPCVGAVGKFVGIGLNYADHAAESGAATPTEPVIFMKATSTIVGAYDEVVQPLDSTKLDWEVELGIIIGRMARYVSPEQAYDHVAGYCVVNDVSERAFQLERGGTWDKGKGCDTFGPIGPWLVTKDEAGDVNNLSLWLKVNGHQYQNGSTRNLIFKPDFLVSYVSRFMTLHPGDLITTGTPAGVGMGQKPPRYLKPGDEIHLGITNLGEQRQTVVSYKD